MSPKKQQKKREKEKGKRARLLHAGVAHFSFFFFLFFCFFAFLIFLSLCVYVACACILILFFLNSVNVSECFFIRALRLPDMLELLTNSDERFVGSVCDITELSERLLVCNK